MEKQRFFLIILGSDENAYGNCRLFSEAYSARPLIICTRRLVPTQHSKAMDFLCIPGFDTDEIFVPELNRILKQKSEEYEKILVLPCSDYYTALLSRHAAEFEGRIANPILPYDLLNSLDVKDSFYAQCRAHGLPYPPSYVALPEERLTAADKAGLGWPLIVKPENSNAYEYLHCQFEGKKKVFFFRTPEEYRTVMQSMNQSDYQGKIILQKFVPGGDSSMRVVNAYCSGDGKVLAMAMGQPVLEEYAPKTLGNYAAIIVRRDDAILEMTKTFLEGIGYVGFANLDFKIDAGSGQPYAFELNPRLGRSSFFASAGGINFMKIMVEDVVFHHRENIEIANPGALWSNVPMGILRKYVSDADLKREIMTIYRQSGVSRTLLWKKDFSLARYYRIWRYYLSQYKSYAKYYFQK